MGEVSRPRRLKVRGASKEALLAAASKACAQETAAPTCERVLVVYGEAGANIYVESSTVLSPPARRAS